MAQPLRFGITASPNVPWPTMVQRVRHLEQLGFDSFWLPDHFVSWVRPASPRLECWTTLAGLAAHTDRIRLGTLVTNITYRNPALLAREALTLDHISNGRLELGIGAAGAPFDHSTTGIAVWDTRQRVRRFREFVEIVDSLFGNELTTYEGTYYWVREAVMSPAPVQHPRPPLTIAAHGRVTLKIAAERGDSWNSAPVAGREMLERKSLSAVEALEVTQRRSELLDEQCVGVGRDPSTIRRSICAVPPPYTLDTPWLSTVAFEEFVERYHRIGITEFIFMYPLEDYYPADQVRPGIFERIATQVIPAIQRSA